MFNNLQILIRSKTAWLAFITIIVSLVGWAAGEILSHVALQTILIAALGLFLRDSDATTQAQNEHLIDIAQRNHNLLREAEEHHVTSPGELVRNPMET